MNEENLNFRLLYEGCKRKHRASQLRLYEHFYSYGMSICLRYSKNREEAQEVLNDAFLKVFTKIDQYDPDYPFKPWLRQVLIYASIDYYRKYQKLNNEKEIVEERDTPTTSQNEGIENLEYEDLLEVLQLVPPSYRLVFNLFAVDGLSHQEIADKLGISVGTSKSNLAKARMKLRNLLDTSAYSKGLKSKENG